MIDLKQIDNFHIPLFGYFSSVYMGFLGIFQAMAFGALILQATISFNNHGLSFDLVDHVNVLLIATILWHKYIIHHQFIGWQLSIIDTMLVIIFGFIEGIMVSCLQFNWIIYPWVSLIILVGAIAYRFAEHQFNDEYIRHEYKKHYGDNWESLYYGLVGYERISSNNSIATSFILAIFFLPTLLTPQGKLITSFLTLLTLITYLFLLDIKRLMSNTNEWTRLSKLGKRISDSN